MKRKRSEQLFKQAACCIPGGVNSPVRAFASVGGSPLFLERARGSRVFDADRNSYLDYVMSWGALVLGHAHPLVLTKLKQAMDKGTSFGAPTEKEIVFARKICAAVPSIDKLRMVSSGTEATMSAIRLARGYTGKDKIIKFEGCYHGSVDSLLVKAGSGQATLGIPTSLGVSKALAEDTLVCPYNDISTFRAIVEKHRGSIAGCILEPVCGNMGVVLPEDGFLEQVREITAKENIVLIFDEVITGFRFCYGGVQNIFKVIPDLTCLGKIIGGGLPCAAYGGKEEIMDCIAPQGSVYQAGTLSGNPLAVTAGLATLEILETMDYKALAEKAAGLCLGLEQVLSDSGLAFSLNRFGSMFTVFFSREKIRDFSSAKTSDTVIYGKYFWSMLEQGINLAPSQFEANFVSFSHSREDCEATVRACAGFCLKHKEK